MKKIMTVFIALGCLLFALSDANSGLLGDVDLDGTIGLTEAVNALQVTSGMRSALSASYVISWKGTWTTGQNYQVYDAVQLNGSSYICLQSHTSDISKQPPYGPVWEPLALKGDKGEMGAMGPTGATGPQGLTGEPGTTGSQGPQGAKGDTGATGLQGPQGERGATGPQGEPGALNPNIIIAGNNTAIGINDLSANTTGEYNSATGYQALLSNTTGSKNTAIGSFALYSNTTAYDNTASGYEALYFNTTGFHNTASGSFALFFNTTGYSNTASGYEALDSNTTGSGNVALGFQAGYYLLESFTGSNNIYLGYQVYPASADESDTIRIGNGQTKTFVAGISGASSTGGSAVYVNSSGQLGTAASSRRYKEDIQDMDDASSALMLLRPVTFYYKAEYSDEPRALQYGLIAEEVATVYPDLVQYDPKTGSPQTVQYHLVNAMLLNEVQKQQRQILKQKEELSILKERLSKVEALVIKQE